jgi:hypothetical protein
MDAIPFDMDNIFDVLVTDVDEKVLSNEIPEALGAQYLSPASNSPQAIVKGIIYGQYQPVIFPSILGVLRHTSP